MEMTADELKENFKRLTLEAIKVLEVNDELEAAYMSVCEAELDADAESAPELTEQQKTDLERTAKECEQKLKEVKGLIQQTLWANFGERNLSLALRIAEGECKLVSSAKPNISVEAYHCMLDHLEKLVRVAREAHLQWSRWAPPPEKIDFDSCLKELELCFPKLASRKAMLIQAAGIKKDIERMPIVASPTQVAAIKLKATSLPKFTGNKRDFYRWRKEWEALQRQGEPTGSKEVKKFQLLDSLEDKVARNLRISTYNTADEIFRVLENRYGNKAAIALEIVEELQAIPAVRSCPRRTVELIRAVEKALYDLEDLGNLDAIKNPIVTMAIESKLPETMKKEWLMYVSGEGNNVSTQNRFDKLLTFLQAQDTIYEQLDQLQDDEYVKMKSTQPSAYTICGDVKHQRKLYLSQQKEEMLQIGWVPVESVLKSTVTHPAKSQNICART